MKKISYQDRKLALIEEITVAFDGVTRENGVTLHEAMVLDNYGSPEERAEARQKDTETKWQDVPEADIRNSDAVLSFLDEKGLHYYVPAYVIWYLQGIDQNQFNYLSNTFDSVIFHLTYQLGNERQDAGRFVLFTNEQKRAIAHFLIFAAEREEKMEKQSIRTSLVRGGLSKSEVDKTMRAYKPADNQIRQAVENYWEKLV